MKFKHIRPLSRKKKILLLVLLFLAGIGLILAGSLVNTFDPEFAFPIGIAGGCCLYASTWFAV